MTATVRAWPVESLPPSVGEPIIQAAEEHGSVELEVAGAAAMAARELARNGLRESRPDRLLVGLLLELAFGVAALRILQKEQP